MSKTATRLERDAARRDRKVQIAAERTMKNTMFYGCDPRNSHEVQARRYSGPGFPPTEIVDGKRVFKF